MKSKHTAVIIALVLAVVATVFAVEKQSATAAPRLIRLKSNGATIAELKLPKGTQFEIKSPESTHEKDSGRLTAKGGVTIQIKHAGGSSVIVQAEEIDMVSEAQ